jgi:hypothetical protein
MATGRVFMNVAGAGAAWVATLKSAAVAGLAPRTVISPAHAQANLGRLGEIYKEFGDYIFLALPQAWGRRVRIGPAAMRAQG